MPLDSLLDKQGWPPFYIRRVNLNKQMNIHDSSNVLWNARAPSFHILQVCFTACLTFFVITLGHKLDEMERICK